MQQARPHSDAPVESARLHHSGEAPASPNPGSDAQHAIDTGWLQISKEVLHVGKGFIELALLELALAAKTVPKIIASALAAAVFALLAWLALGVCAGWAAALLTGLPILAPLTFLLLQVIALGVCAAAIKRHKQLLTLPNTRAHWQQFKGAINEAAKGNQ